MSPRLLPYLACPGCHSGLQLQVSAETAGEIQAGRLDCPACGASYPIRRGIPRFVPTHQDRERQLTASAFGYEWRRFAALTEQYEQQFLDWIAPVPRSFFVDRVVLDGGCGKGRHLHCAARFGAREVIGVDLSEAVESAYANTRHLPNAHVIQADLHHLPLQPARCDYVYSIGVLHHLPDPRAGFQALLPALRPGGRISAWVYGRENNEWIVKLVSPIREALVGGVSLPALSTACGLGTALTLWPLLKLVYGPVRRRRPAWGRRLWYFDYLSYIARFSFREVHSIVFDHLVAPTAFYLSQREFRSWFDGPGFSEVQIGWHNSNSWRGTARWHGSNSGN